MRTSSSFLLVGALLVWIPVSVGCSDEVAPTEATTLSRAGSAPLATPSTLGVGSTTQAEDEDQGCSQGYWKKHTDSWSPAGFNPAQQVLSVFAEASGYPALGSEALLQALKLGGGRDLEGAVRNLLRQAVAAVLNASHPGVDYPRPLAQVIGDVNVALASGDRQTMLALKSDLDADNNLGCPLN